MLNTSGRGQVVEGPFVAPADELGSAAALDVGFLGVALDRDPLPVLLESIFLVRMDRRSDIRGQCPGRSRPDRKGLTMPVEERKADEKRGIYPLLVTPDKFVRRDGGTAAGAPLS